MKVEKWRFELTGTLASTGAQAKKEKDIVTLLSYTHSLLEGYIPVDGVVNKPLAVPIESSEVRIPSDRCYCILFIFVTGKESLHESC